MDTFLEVMPSLPARAMSPAAAQPRERKTAKGKDLSLASSLTLHESLCSVHLARLYEAQKKPQKAIEMYRRLMARDPAQEAYFASKIQNLKN